MKLTSLLKCSAAVVVALGLATNAWGHGSSTVQVNVVVDAGALKITSGMDVGGWKVFADNTDVFNVSGQSTVPGWAFDAALNSKTIRVNVLDNLLYWTPASGLAATTTDNLALRRLFFPVSPDSAIVGQTTITDPMTTIWDSSTVGQSHHIMRYEVPAGSPPAAYGVMLQLQDISGLLGPSDPFLLVLNKGLTNTPDDQAGQDLDDSQFGQAITDMTDSLTPEAVPEPATLGLMGLAALTSFPLLRRLRKRPSAT